MKENKKKYIRGEYNFKIEERYIKSEISNTDLFYTRYSCMENVIKPIADLIIIHGWNPSSSFNDVSN